MRKILIALIVLTLFASSSSADNIKLPEPDKTGGMSLNEAATLRHTAREFADVEITLQELSDLLYVAAGANRENGLRVYPVAMGLQDTFVYVFTRDGVCKFDAPSHSLELIAEGDKRNELSRAPFVSEAAVTLVYVHDMKLWEGTKAPKELVAQWRFAHTGAIMQNAYLFAASKGWNAVVQGTFNNEKLREILKLNDEQNITLIHSIGPKP